MSLLSIAPGLTAMNVGLETIILLESVPDPPLTIFFFSSATIISCPDYCGIVLLVFLVSFLLPTMSYDLTTQLG